MCFRLWVATHPPETFADAKIEQAAVKHGLDVRLTEGPRADFTQVGWGDCACCLYTGRKGRERVVAWMKELFRTAQVIQLLLLEDESALHLNGPIARCEWEQFAREGLGALEIGRVTEIGPAQGREP